MYSQQELDDAVAAGAITSESATALRAFVANQRSSSLVDEEHFRLITGFNDIFVSIAGVILLFAVGWIGQSIGSSMGFHIGAATERSWDDGPSALAGLLVAAVAWGLASYFTAKRRMALPSIVFLLAFIGGTFVAAGTLLLTFIDLDAVPEDNAPQVAAIVFAAAALVAAVGAWLHWKKFRVPITVAVGAAAAAAIVVSLLATLIAELVGPESMGTVILVLVLLAGLAIFAWAMKWDASDQGRVTRRSDVAFWLHLVAAPMIVHPVFTLLGLNDGDAAVWEGFVVIALYVALGVAALAIDRRALLVSALAYVLIALTSLFREFGAVELNIALTALVIGSALLLLSAFWHQARGAVLDVLPASLVAKLPARHSVSKKVASEPAA